MKLVTIAAPPTGRTGMVVDNDVLDFLLAGHVLPLAAWVPSDMPTLLQGGPDGLDLLRRLADVARTQSDALRACDALVPLSDVRLSAPVPRPGILLSHGRSYHSHAREMAKGGPPKPQNEPSAFLKNQHSIVGPGATITLPAHFPDMVDLEGEFSIVFGSACHNIEPSEAMAAVAGYTLINDVSARNWVENFLSTNNPDLNRMGKQFPGFTPMGPLIVTSDEIPDPHDVRLVTMLNGTIMQDAHTSDLIWRVPELIAYFSRWYSFQPGDILTTGSPAGVGFAREPKVFMKAGDVVTVSVAQIGDLTNSIRSGAG